MRAIIVATVTLAALAGLALDAVAERALGEAVLAPSAAASCIEDGVTGQCHTLCVPPPRPLDWACPM